MTQDQPVHGKRYLEIVAANEEYLDRHGDNFRGVGWTRTQEEVDLRYGVMLDVIREKEPVTLLDFGCGASHLYDYIRRIGRADIDYSGLDLSSKFLELSRKKFPSVTYYQADLAASPDSIPQFDYIVMNGIFNSKCALSHDEMFTYLCTLVDRAFRKARRGIAFNVMTKYVDWERDDLFHLTLDQLAGFLVRMVSRNFVIRHDYGQWEYTTYVYR
jgi:SAM-dependent methyltransferase